MSQPQTSGRFDEGPSQSETKSRWVSHQLWPYPFERFSQDDPISKRQEKILKTSGIEDARVQCAMEMYDGWTLDEYEGKLLEKQEQQSVDQSQVMNLANQMGSTDSVMSIDNDYDLHDNVAVDLIKYIRSSTIRNEEQFLLMSLAYVSGLSDDTHDYVSSVAIGTSSSGKSHLKDKIDDLFKHLNVMDASTGTDKSLHHDEDWDDADVISMGELQQPSEEMLEFMKRAHGGDEEVVIRQTVGNPSQGFHTEVTRKKAKSYHFTYAQFDADFEFWNRLLKLPVHESESKNRAVGRMAFNHGDINLGDGVEYGYTFDHGTERLQAHLLELKRQAPKRAIIPNGGTRFEFDVWDVIEPIFQHSRSESNRVYKMVSNLIKASAMANFHSRETITVSERTDEGVKQIDAVVANAQDVANVIRCLDVLRATTHEIDQRKRAVVDAIKTKSSGDEDSVEGLEPIIEFLKESDASQVNKPELENIIDDLESNYVISVDGDTYTANNWDALGEPRVDKYSHIFENTVDPVDAEPFMDWWEKRRQEISTSGSDLLDGSQIESQSAEINEATNTVSDNIPDLDAERWVAELYHNISGTLNNTRIGDMTEVPVEGFIGLVDPNDPDLAGVETKGTLLDPEHAVWDQEDKPDEWVVTETDARRKIQQGIQELMQLGNIGIKEIHKSDEEGNPIDVTMKVVR